MLDEEVVSILRSLDSFCEDVKKILYGNGRPGLVDRMNVIETKVCNRVGWITIVPVICTIVTTVLVAVNMIG